MISSPVAKTRNSGLTSNSTGNCYNQIHKLICLDILWKGKKSIHAIATCHWSCVTFPVMVKNHILMRPKKLLVLGALTKITEHRTQKMAHHLIQKKTHRYKFRQT